MSDEEICEKLLEAENNNSKTYSEEEFMEFLNQIVENNKEDK